jgi:hypothetical protein
MLTPAEKASIVQQAMHDTLRHGKPGDLDKLLAYLKANPNAVEELAAEHRKGTGEQRTGKASADTAS